MDMLVIVAVIGGGAVIAGLAARWLVAHTNIGRRDYSKLDPDAMVTVARFSTALDAELWRGRLNAAGVSCMVTGEISSTLVRFPNLSGPCVRLEVLVRDAQRAQAVLGGR